MSRIRHGDLKGSSQIPQDMPKLTTNSVGCTQHLFYATAHQRRGLSAHPKCGIGSCILPNSPVTPVLQALEPGPMVNTGSLRDMPLNRPSHLSHSCKLSYTDGTWGAELFSSKRECVRGCVIAFEFCVSEMPTPVVRSVLELLLPLATRGK